MEHGCLLRFSMRRPSSSRRRQATEMPTIWESEVAVAVLTMMLCSNMFQMTSVVDNETANVRGLGYRLLRVRDTLF